MTTFPFLNVLVWIDPSPLYVKLVVPVSGSYLLVNRVVESTASNRCAFPD